MAAENRIVGKPLCDNLRNLRFDSLFRPCFSVINGRTTWVMTRALASGLGKLGRAGYLPEASAYGSQVESDPTKYTGRKREYNY